jgi:hypothetical protein
LCSATGASLEHQSAGHRGGSKYAHLMQRVAPRMSRAKDEAVAAYCAQATGLLPVARPNPSRSAHAASYACRPRSTALPKPLDPLLCHHSRRRTQRFNTHGAIRPTGRPERGMSCDQQQADRQQLDADNRQESSSGRRYPWDGERRRDSRRRAKSTPTQLNSPASQYLHRPRVGVTF